MLAHLQIQILEFLAHAELLVLLKVFPRMGFFVVVVSFLRLAFFFFLLFTCSFRLFSLSSSSTFQSQSLNLVPVFFFQ